MNKIYPAVKKMKVVVLAGGLGTRLSEETDIKPKPLVEIGGRPILWHILKHFSHYGFQEFVIALGYKGDSIKHYFADYLNHNGSLTVDMRKRTVVRHESHWEDWKVHLMETGQETLTGGRLGQLSGMLRDGTFMMTYGDGVADVDLTRLLKFHKSHGKLATVTAVRPPARFGAFDLAGDRVKKFREKPEVAEGWISGGFFVLEPGALDYLTGKDVYWEREPMERLARDGQLMAYRHESFWQCMDTARDRRHLESLWASGKAPWNVWR